MSVETRRGPEPPDLSERGGNKDGRPQRLDRRLFMQFLAFGGCPDARPLGDALARAKISGVLYEDVNDPRGIGLLTVSEDPDFFLDRVRPLLNGPGFSVLVQKPEYTMLGRSYAIGYEPDLEEVLLNRPRRTVLNPLWKWGVWYPLRRSGKFAQLSDQDQRVILSEHGAIGMSFGAGDDLARFGLDQPRAVRPRRHDLAEPFRERDPDRVGVERDAHVGEHRDPVPHEQIEIVERRRPHEVGHRFH